MKLGIGFLFILLLVIGCKKSSKKNEVETMVSTIPSKEKFATVVINSEIDLPVSVSFPKSLNNFLDYRVISKNDKDTFKLKAENPNLVLVSHNKMYTDSVILTGGDTLFLKFSKDSIYTKRLVVQNKNSNDLSKIFGIINSSPEKRKIDSLASLLFQTDYANPINLHNDYEKIDIYPFKLNHDYIKKHKSNFKKLADLKMAFFNECRRKYFIGKDSEIGLGILREKTFTEIVDLYNISKDKSILSVLTSDTFLNEATPSYPFGYTYLYRAVYDIYFKHLQKSSRSKIFYNQFQIYDSIPKHFDSTLIKYGRMISLTQMAEQANEVNKTTSYFENFNKTYNDSVFQKHFQNTYLVNLKQLYNSKTDMNLINKFKEVIKLNDVLNEFQGKAVYIDFWASWCAPCRKVMHASKELQHDYEQEDIKMVYISIDKNGQDWQNASAVEGLQNYKYSYLLLNKDKSAMMKELGINTIPRYLFYNGEGKLIHSNAPGPEGSEIRELFDTYLKKNKE